MKLIIGTRGSALALWQSGHVRDLLLALPGTPVREVELRVMQTKGDRILDVALSRVGGKGLFVKELEDGLLAGDIHMAVHSLKDMPSELPAGLELVAYPERADVRDGWILPQGASKPALEDLPPGSVVGTSSLRRQAQILARRPDLHVAPVRGNVETRLRKLDEGVDGMVAMVLACAGLDRLGLSHRIAHRLSVAEMLPAAGQGALVIEARSLDDEILALVRLLDDPAARCSVTAERAFLATFGGGCEVPIGAYAERAEDTLTVHGIVARPDGTETIRMSISGPVAQAARLGQTLAKRVMALGGARVLAASTRQADHVP